IRKYKSIIVYSNPPILPLVAILANILFGTEIIFVCYDVYPEIAEKTKVLSSNSLISKFMKRVNNQLFKRAASVIALSEDMKRYLVTNRNIQPDKVAVIPNWATEETSIKTIETSYNKNDDETFIITYLGNMGIPQDLDTILEAMNNKLLKNNIKFKFIFAWHGNKKNKSNKVEDNPNGNTEKKIIKTIETSYNKNDDETFIITYLGNMGIPQDLDTILEAMNNKLLKNNIKFKFIFAGHGNQKDKIKEFINVNNITNVEIHGFLTGDKLNNLINQTDAFLVTLKKELLGLAVPSKFYTYLLQGKK